VKLFRRSGASTKRFAAKTIRKVAHWRIGFSTKTMPPLTLLSVQEFLAQNGAAFVPQPHYFSDLAPCDTLFFQNTIWHWREEDLVTSSRFKNNRRLHFAEFKTQDFCKCFQQWCKIWVHYVKSYEKLQKREAFVVLLSFVKILTFYVSNIKYADLIKYFPFLNVNKWSFGKENY
jgi:hypothetical protein